MAATTIPDLSYTQALRLLRSSSDDIYIYMYRAGWGLDSVNSQHPAVKRYTISSRRYLAFLNPVTGGQEPLDLSEEDLAATDWVVSNAVID